MAKAVFCIAKTERHAYQIVSDLCAAGFANDDISVLFSDKGTTRDFALEGHTKAPEGAVAGVGTGGVVGGTLGWLTGTGMLAIPGLGPFVAAGPILAALSGVSVGATVGGIAGALIGYRVPEYEAKRYQGKIVRDRILISVHTEDRRQRQNASEVFERAGAEDVSSAAEVPADYPPVLPV